VDRTTEFDKVLSGIPGVYLQFWLYALDFSRLKLSLWPLEFARVGIGIPSGGKDEALHKNHGGRERNARDAGMLKGLALHPK
jgi:hypothetical protein